MRITIVAARALLEDVLQAGGQDRDAAAAIADHLLDAELRGLRQGGLARAISIRERLAHQPAPSAPLRVEHDTPVAARVAGGDQLGYLVARRATELAIDKARATGIAMVAANDTWYTGMLSYYAERAVAQGLAVMIASNASAWVAPHGASEGRFGTNPLCFGFPSSDGPVIWDIGTSRIIHADAMLARRLGQPLVEGVAYDAQGRPTTDPDAALGGALVNWGGAKGSGLGLVVQLLGIMAGSTTIPRELAGFGFLIVAMNPEVLGPGEDFPARAAEYAHWVRSARPLDPGAPVRMPFERSARARAERLQAGWIELPEAIHAQLQTLRAPAGVAP